MHPPRPTETAHWIMQSHIRPGDVVIDATAGNGHDTAFLAQAVGAAGHVHAIDIQAVAIERAKRRIAEENLSDRVVWHVADHAEMRTLVPASEVSTVVFNLGYLPGDDHQTTTNRESTRLALQSAAERLSPGGLLSVLCYPGHQEGAIEAEQVASLWPSWSEQGWRISCYSLPFTKRPSPVLWMARKPGTSQQD